MCVLDENLVLLNLDLTKKWRAAAERPRTTREKFVRGLLNELFAGLANSANLARSGARQ